MSSATAGDRGDRAIHLALERQEERPVEEWFEWYGLAVSTAASRESKIETGLELYSLFEDDPATLHHMMGYVRQKVIELS